jgi:hypothetical protein
LQFNRDSTLRIGGAERQFPLVDSLIHERAEVALDV